MREGRQGIWSLRDLCGCFAAFALTCSVAFALLAPLFSASAWAACTGVVAEGGARMWRVSADEKAAAITYLGHASFLI
ncbi:MAG: hypothetical protein AB7T18_10670, partial [Alphaproteobacteria bacterium]